ncbi:MAG: methyltransferase domain-containing protein [Pyrinomonadaceae bacterium]|nr:methyltransferase domain-containing protein [Pyrinomonadaceae bacterium]MBP6214486.1 methyltransferase domain-containing protein [Pyrinomonadaceae bacterium]
MFSRFKQRSYRLERLDTGDYTPEEYAKWHREMRFIHRLFGEMRALRPLILRDARKVDGTVRILDIGAGSGELLRAVRRWLGDRTAFLVGAELNAKAARAIYRGSERGVIDVLQCDALLMPFADDSFDYVYCSLFLHHLTDDKAVKLLREMSRVAARGIYVVDLHRSPVAYYFYRAVSRVVLQPFTREDGALSILRSYKPAELRALATEAGLSDVRVRRSAAYRLVLSGTK